jgi:apolipoprotein N-acyltransferase
VTSGKSGTSLGRWQRRALRSVLPAGFTLFTLWILWFVMTLLDGAMTSLGAVQTALGLAASVALILAGSAYRRVMGED